MTGAEILNPNGSELDGRMSHLGTFFDVKGFAFQEALVEKLRAKLQKDMPGTWIAMQGTWDVSIDALQNSLAGATYRKLLADLNRQRAVVTVDADPTR